MITFIWAIVASVMTLLIALTVGLTNVYRTMKSVKNRNPAPPEIPQLDYWRIADLEREIYGGIMPNVDYPPMIIDAYFQSNDPRLEKRLNVDPKAPTLRQLAGHNPKLIGIAATITAASTLTTIIRKVNQRHGK